MKIYILANNVAKEGFIADDGLSILIEHKEKKILFDTGYSKAIFDNAEKLGLDLKNIDYLILSHGHKDHTNNIEDILNISKPKIYCHENVFVKRYSKKDNYIGMPLTRYEIEQGNELIATKKPIEIFEGVFFLGEIPRRSDFEGKRSFGYYFENEKKKEDYVIDDSALAIKTDSGLTIISGCAHSGITNISEYAKQVTEEQKIFAIISGFHLKDAYLPIINKTINYLKSNNIENIFVTHCIGELAIKEFTNQNLPFKVLVAGDIIEL